MNSILIVDDTWTIDTFKRQYSNGDLILQANGLPNPICPYATLASQLDELAFRKAAGITVDYDEAAHVNAIKANLTDTNKAIALAELTEATFPVYTVLGIIPGYLMIPMELVDKVVPVPNYLQSEILQQTTVTPIQEILRKLQPIVDIPYSEVTVGSESVNWYWKPRGEVTIQVEGQLPLEIPCWPDDISDNVSASWSQEMTTYQHYEPQNTYKQSGPRVLSCTFKIHRAMWDGNQDSGKSEELVAYMQSACYPDYDKQAAEPPRVTLIVGKSIRIVGILTTMDTKYHGPIGPDCKYDCVDISISITEESDNVLSTNAVRSGLAGWR